MDIHSYTHKETHTHKDRKHIHLVNVELQWHCNNDPCGNGYGQCQANTPLKNAALHLSIPLHLKEHTLAFKEHTLGFKEHTLALKEHTLRF